MVFPAIQVEERGERAGNSSFSESLHVTRNYIFKAGIEGKEWVDVCVRLISRLGHSGSSGNKWSINLL